MRKSRRSYRRKPKEDSTFDWLPIDSRLIAPLFSFGRVKGMARVFLQIEIICSLLIVAGTIVLVILRMGIFLLLR